MRSFGFVSSWKCIYISKAHIGVELGKHAGHICIGKALASQWAEQVRGAN